MDDDDDHHHNETRDIGVMGHVKEPFPDRAPIAGMISWSYKALF
jgi:hypothetical protein